MQWDVKGNPRPSPPAKTNAERQREFRRRNPGYYGRLKAKQRAACRAHAEVALAVNAIVHAYLTTPLMLPAPVEPIEIPGITIPLSRTSSAEAMVEIHLRDAA